MSNPANSGLYDEQIEYAAQRLIEGGLVAFPTETVYGLGADAENPVAVQGIYTAKGRPSNHPLIVHVHPEADLSYWVSRVPEQAEKLMAAFWPGPLTLILPRHPRIPDTVSGGQATIGIRCPSHPVAQALLRRMAALKPSGQAGVAAPSANKFGAVSPTQAQHVAAEFPELNAEQLYILAAGDAQVGIESTIVDVSRIDQGVGPVLLRPGHITVAMLSQVLGVEPLMPDQQAPQVSGSLKAHYAPHTELALFDANQVEQLREQIQQRGEPQAVLAFPALAPFVAPNLAWYVCADEAERYAQLLYATLRRLDQGQYQKIWIQACPKTPAWLAVNDRLGRAAAAFEQ